MGPLEPILDPNLLLIAEIDDEPAGFSLGLPDWTARARGLKGKTSLVAQLRFAPTARGYTDAGLFAVGVLERHQGKHIGQTLASTLYRRFEPLGLSGAEYHINDANTPSRTLAASLDGQGRILYHDFGNRWRRRSG